MGRFAAVSDDDWPFSGGFLGIADVVIEFTAGKCRNGHSWLPHVGIYYI
jgi:hypothetical protein